MSEATRLAPTEGGPAITSASNEVLERGALRVADRVVEKVARAAVLGVPGVAPDTATAGAVGRALGRTYPQVSCARSGDRARVQLEVALVWPYPAAVVARDVCVAVSDQLLTYAGVHVDEVRTTVALVVDPSDITGTDRAKEPRVR